MDKKAEQERDDVLRRMLKTPPNPHKERFQPPKEEPQERSDNNQKSS